MLFAYNVIRTVIRLPYTLKRGKNDIHDDMRFTVKRRLNDIRDKTVKRLNRLNDIRAMLFAVKL